MSDTIQATDTPANSPATTDLPELSPHVDGITQDTAKALYHVYHNEIVDQKNGELLSQAQHTQRQLAFLKSRIETEQAQTTAITETQIPLLLSKADELEHIFVRIDRLYALVSSFEDCCDEYEQRCDNIERVQGSRSVRKKIGSLFKSMLATESSTTEAKMPETADCEEMLPKVSDYMAA